MKRYGELFGIPNVWALVLACFPARAAYGMVSLSIFFKVQQSTNSISTAGLALGLNAASGALTAGIRGSIMDKFGQKWPLRSYLRIAHNRTQSCRYQNGNVSSLLCHGVERSTNQSFRSTVVENCGSTRVLKNCLCS